MTPKIHTTRSKKGNQNNLVYEVVRPQRKKLSRYKLKKQTGIIEQILDDPQIMDV
jgi:hypothetical protein